MRKRRVIEVIAAASVAAFVAVLAALPGTARAAGAGPSGATAIALASSVELSWQPVAGASAYSVYRGTSPTSVTTAMTPPGGIAAPATSFTDTSAVNGTTYYYVVRAVVAGSESSNSLVVQATPQARSCSSGNVVVVENCYPGTTNWDVRNAATIAAGGIEGYATAQSVNKGDALILKVNSAASYNIEIYRTGWYGGAEARLFSIVRAVPASPQPACATDSTTGLVDCANWTPSATISTTVDWPSGVYVARIVRTDNATDNQILFVVRDDSRHPDLIYGEGMATLQAYNNYGGKSLYTFNSSGSNTVSGTPRAVKVSFDRPFEQPRSGLRDWYTRTEIATVAWLERMGYDVSYISDGDLESNGGLLLNAKAYVSPAHEEYVSAAMRAAMTNARDAGVNLFFTGSNEVYWKIRFENSPTTGAPLRTEVCYKTVESGGPDPSGISTSTWRDPNGPNNPENALSGEMYIGDNDTTYFPFVVDASQGQDRVYRFTGLDQLAPGTSQAIGGNLTGWEWDARVSNGFEPAGVKTLSGSPVTGELIQNAGASYLQNQSATVSMVKYKAPSGALVVTTGTNHWNRGLALNAAGVGEPNLTIQQTTTNILEDMGVRPATQMAGIVLDPVPGLTPAPPTAVTATTGGSDSIQISWQAAAGAASYNVYRTLAPRDGGYPLGVRVNPAPVTGTSFTDFDLASGTTYYYVVTSVSNGVEGVPSTEASASTATAATAPVRINSGDGAYTTVSGAAFAADGSFSGGSTYAITQSISGTNDPSLYQNERWGQFTYAVSVPNGTYDVRFHFVELYYGTAVAGSCVGKRVFSMDVLNTPASPDIQNLDICALVGPRAALVKTVTGVQVTNGTLTVKSVYGCCDDPEVAAIEVIPSSSAPPTVTATNPAANATGVSVSVDPTATFSRAMDAATLTSSTFVLKDAGGAVVPASVSYNATTSTAMLTPSSPLAASTTYTATVTTGARASDGTPLSAPYSWTFTTAAASDTTPPTAPTGLTATGGLSTVALAWTASTDNVAVTRYDVYRSTTSGFTPSASNRIAQPSGTTYTDSGLAAGTYYYAVEAEDGAGNLSAPSNQASATVTGDTTAPTVSLTAPADGSTVSGTIAVTANASDNVAVAGVQFKLDGVNLGAEDTTAPYSVQWDTTQVGNGAHTLTAVARDAAGNTTTSAGVGVSVQNAAPPPASPLMGDQNVESTVDYDDAGMAEAFQATASASGTITSISVYVDSGSAATTLDVGLYADGGGKPGTLLGHGSSSGLTAGAWNTIAVSSASVTSGATYWIALLAPSGSGRIKFRDHCCGKGTSPSSVSSSSSLTDLPASWSSGGVYNDGPASAYASGTTSQSALAVSPSHLTFGAEVGGPNPPSAQLSVTNTGAGSMSVTVSTDASWLTATPTSGSAPLTLQVSAASSALAAGTYTGHVTVTSAGAQGSPAVIPVALAVSGAASSADWLMADHDPGRSGSAPSETALSTSTAPDLALSWSTVLDGKVTTQPLFAKAIEVNGQTHDIVLVGTAANSVYALDAASGAVLWHRNFGAQETNCAIPGGFGVTAPPAIDRSTGRAYVVANDGSLHALALADGSDAATPLPLIGNATTNKVWGGLNLVGSTLYVADASDGCDTAPWRSAIYRVDVSGSTPALLGSWVVVPSIPPPNGGGGIWGYGGVSADTASGDVFAATAADSNEQYTLYGDRMVALDGALNVLGSFLPSEPSSFPCDGTPCDLDFGATAVVFHPAGCPLMVGAGNKNGEFYLFRAADLAATAPPLQTLVLNQPNDSLGSGGVGGVPAYWPAGNMLFVTDAGPGANGIAGGVVGLSVQPDCTLKVAWSQPLGGNDQQNSTPTVANGLVFVDEGNGGKLHVYDATTGAQLYSGGAAVAASYGAPSVGDGRVYVPSWNGFTAADGGTVTAFAPVATGVSVSITAPPAGATVSGTTTVSASTSGSVAGVQFQVDGVNIGTEDTTSPYSVSWDTTTATDGTHSLTAVARATGGGTTSSTPVSVTVSNSAPPATTVLVGDQTVEPSVDYDNGGQAEASQTTAAAGGTLTQASLYLDAGSTATKVIVGLYSDNGGHPGTLLATGTITAPTQGWNTVPMSSASVTAGSTYWLAVLAPTGAGTVKFHDRCCGGGGATEVSAQTTLAALPASWTSGSSYHDGPISVYGSGS